MNKTSPISDIENGEASGLNIEADEATNNSRRSSIESGNIKFGNDEVTFERGLNLSYM